MCTCISQAHTNTVAVPDPLITRVTQMHKDHLLHSTVEKHDVVWEVALRKHKTSVNYSMDRQIGGMAALTGVQMEP